MFLKNLYSFSEPFRCILAFENATRHAPKDQLRMRLKQAWRRGHLVQFPQFFPNAKEQHGYSATDALFVPIVAVRLIESFEIPQTPPGAEENARPDERASFDVALPVSSPG
jgi:hypothetical protein